MCINPIHYLLFHLYLEHTPKHKKKRICNCTMDVFLLIFICCPSAAINIKCFLIGIQIYFNNYNTYTITYYHFMNFPVVGMASRLTQMWERKKPHLQSLSISYSPFQSPAVSSSGLLQSHPVYYGLPVYSSLFQSPAPSSSLLRHLPVSCSFFQWSLPVYSSLPVSRCSPFLSLVVPPSL